MKTYLPLFLLLILPAFAFSQSTTKTKAKTNSIDSTTIPLEKPDGMPLAMNQCHVKAVVKKILPAGIDGVMGTACDTVPCVAEVEIKEVNGVGMAFRVNLNPGNVLAANFAFTLINTAKILPTLHPTLPGLKVGDVFIANLEARDIPGGGFKFYITTYKKLSKG
jgi:hypothetical protein